MSELVATPGLDRTRRNMLFSTGVLLIVGLADPDKVGLPGFGEEKIDGPLALILIMGAVCLFWWEYWIEYRLTRTRSSELFEQAGETNLRPALAEFAKKVDGFRARIEEALQHFEASKQALVDDATSPDRERNLNSEVEDIQREMTAVASEIASFPVPPQPYQTAEQRRELVVSVGGKYDWAARRLALQIQKLEDAHALWLESAARVDPSSAFATATQELEALKLRFDRVAASIEGYQRFAFKWKDLLGPATFTGAAFALSLWRIGSRAYSNALSSPDWAAIAFVVGGALTAFLISKAAADGPWWKWR